MKRYSILGGLVLTLAVTTGVGFRSGERASLPLPAQALTDLAPHPSDSTKFLAASEKEVYLQGENKIWKPLLSLPPSSPPFRKVIAHPRLEETIFVLNEEGILEIPLNGGRPKWIFKTTDPRKNPVHTFTLHPEDPNQIYVGTERGLFHSKDGGKSWLSPFRWPENQRIEFAAFLASEAPLLLLATKGELFFSKDGGHFFESGFSLPLFSEEGLEELREEEEESVTTLSFTSVALSPQNPSQLWVGTSEGVFQSKDGGIDWEKLPERGLKNPRVFDLEFSGRTGELLAALPEGVARFHPDQGRWENLPLGLTQPAVSLALQPLPGNQGERLLVASGREVFEWILKPSEIPFSEPPFLPSPERIELFRKLIAFEPTAREVQKAAIRYGDLGNGKIRRWQAGSRLRALIPRLSFGKKFSLNNNVEVDRGGTNTADVFILGPDEIDKGWDLGLQWELGDFLYSTAQTSIDSRQKLNVELRESILSEVTRIYFERRRIQMEIALSPPASPQENLDLLLRLDELTAYLDALTEGFLSRKLEGIDRDHPELRQIYSMPSEDSHAKHSNI